MKRSKFRRPLAHIIVPANTPLTVTNTGPVAPGTALTFKADSINGTIPEDVSNYS
jgi:hypothetical protein